VVFNGLKLIMCGVHGVHLAVLPEIVPNDEVESADGLPFNGRTSRSRTSSFNIKTFRPRRRARAPESVPPSSELEEDTGELARVLVAEF